MVEFAKIQNIRQAEEELARRIRGNPVLYDFGLDGTGRGPHSRQQQALESNADILIVLGGNRSGKSHFAMAESLVTVTGQQLWKQFRWVRHGFPPNVWYIMPSIPTYKRAIRPKFEMMMPRDFFLGYNEQDHHARFKTVQGLQGDLWFLSAEMRQVRLQGASVDLAIMDETPDKDVFQEVLARLIDRRGRLVLVFSPVNVKSNWVRDELVIPAQMGERPDVEIVYMPLVDDKGEVLVPHLTKEDIKRMEQDYPDQADRAARIYGQFAIRAGLVYSQHNPDIHHVEPFTIPENWTQYWIIDPQYYRFGGLFFAVDEKGNYFIRAEYFSQQQPIADRAARLWVLSCIDRKPERVVPCYVDSANPQDIAELNWHFRRLNIKLGALPLPVQKSVDKMTLRTQSLMEADSERLYPAIIKEMNGVHGAPRLFFFNDLISSWELGDRKMFCSRLFWELNRLSWHKTGKPDKDSADGADLADCLNYGCYMFMKGQALQPDLWYKDLPTEDAIIRIAEREQEKRRRMEPW